MKKMKIAFTFALIVVLAMPLLMAAGCEGASANIGGSAEEVQYADKAFVEDLGKGLEARWALTEEAEVTGTNKEEAEARKTYIQAEMDVIGKYENEPFEDSKLKY